MDNLHFGARSRRKVKRRQLTIAAWLIGIVATILGVPGSNAALSVFHRVDRSHGMAASSISGSHSATVTIPSRHRTFVIFTQPTKRVVRLPKKDTPSKHSAKRTQSRPKPQRRPEAKPTPVASPSPSPTPSPVAVAPAGSISSVIYSAAAEAGISGSYLLSIASCESSLDAQAYNSGGYYGLFQFDQQTWSAYGYGSIYDPVAQSRTAARLIAAGQTSRWPNCA
jgi:hypothetical protein